jgi:hypothetical protein
VDPAQLDGEELARWYQRTPDEIEAERLDRQREAEASFYGDVGDRRAATDARSRDDGWGDGPASGRTWVQVGPNRYRAVDTQDFGDPSSASWHVADASTFRLPPVVTRTTPPISIPSGPNAAIPIDGRPSAPRPRQRGFFERYSPVPFPDADVYVTGLPSPLNAVVPGIGGWFGLGDGSVAKDGDEVDRVYDEQQRRIRGDDEADPPRYAITEDKLRDGQVPQAGQIAAGHRELDPTCHPYGGWEVDPNFPKYSQRAQDYQAQISRTRGLDYVVRIPGRPPVKFDGCAVWDARHELLEAKGPRYASLLNTSFADEVLKPMDSQADRQYKAAAGRPIDWHVAERPAADKIRDLVTGRIDRVEFTPPIGP